MSCYNQRQKWTTPEKVEAETKWDTGRLDNAIDFLLNLELIDVTETNKRIKGLGSPYSKTPITRNIRQTIIRLTEKGVFTVENRQTFNSIFGF